MTTDRQSITNPIGATQRRTYNPTARVTAVDDFDGIDILIRYKDNLQNIEYQGNQPYQNPNRLSSEKFV